MTMTVAQVVGAYLQKYGYLDRNAGDIRSNENVTSALESLQRFANIAVTGEVNSETLALVNTPRCGVADFLPFSTTSNGWQKRHLKYRIDSYTQDLSEAQIGQTISDALWVWAEVSSLTFERVGRTEDADLKILFGSRDHGDNIDFDGSGGVLAHAFLPRRGDAHFDDDENWTVFSNFGINLFIVAAHEFGHSLGLFHSDNRNVLMYPFYNGYDPNFELGTDDIAGIRNLYGGRTAESTIPPRPATREPARPATRPPRPATRPPRPATRPPRPSTRPSRQTSPPTTTQPETRPPTTTRAETRPLTMTRAETRPPPTTTILPGCPDQFDAVFSTATQAMYGFRCEHVYELNTNPGTPRRIRDIFPLLPNNIDAALPIGSRIYFIKFEFQSPLTRFWRELESSPGVCNVDAAMATNDGYYYFFKGNQVYKYRGITLNTVSTISEMFPSFSEDLQSDISALNVLSVQGQPSSTGFVFKNDKSYIIDANTHEILIEKAILF
ncbi:hatching enzyme-like [Antedon mediterranea]|uniref:hatching enzyme-like n=1 Tax=Antedon mediterranea TaxID=105859 RepID=UPI003AF54237